MTKVAQNVLPFKLEATQEELTAHAGLGVFGEFLHALGLPEWLHQYLPKPGSGRGYSADAYVLPLVLMLNGGGRSLEDLRLLKGDTALASLLKRDVFPSRGRLRRLAAPQGEKQIQYRLPNQQSNLKKITIFHTWKQKS